MPQDISKVLLRQITISSIGSLSPVGSDARKESGLPQSQPLTRGTFFEIRLDPWVGGLAMFSRRNKRALTRALLVMLLAFSWSGFASAVQGGTVPPWTVRPGPQAPRNVPQHGQRAGQP